MKRTLSDQFLMESIYDAIRDREYVSVEIILSENFIKKMVKKVAPYAAAAGLTAGLTQPVKGETSDFQDYTIDKTKQYSSLTPKEFYKKTEQQEKTGKFSKKINVETFTKSVKAYLIKKLNGVEELKSSEDVYVDITNIIDKEDDSIMITVEITGKIYASSQENANKKAAAIIKNALEESNVSVDSLSTLYSENVSKQYPYKIKAKLTIK